VSQSTEKPTAATETVLVVENETAIKALVQMALERDGYRVLTAESGSEALRLAAAPRVRSTCSSRMSSFRICAGLSWPGGSSCSDRHWPRSSCPATWTIRSAKTHRRCQFL
jgi:hypothetical protein